MKELDVILEPLAHSGLAAVTDEELPILERMLEANDSDLLAWLMQASEPADAEIASLAVKLSDASRASQGDRIGR